MNDGVPKCKDESMQEPTNDRGRGPQEVLMERLQALDFI